ncbi:MAG: APC family permease, partial [Gammaproteobacteria bacterium]|nr:APC family permease [Gammaproteobacteria bacterium]
MGIAGTAPAFSATATTATLIAAVGVLAAGSLLYCGLIMLGITFAFMHLNKMITNAGASYAWVGKVFHPTLGFLAGWALLVASTVFMVSGTIPAATATLILIAPKFATAPGAVTFVAAGWLLVVSAIVVKGIKPTSYTQVIMTTIEVGVLVAVIIASIIHYNHEGAHLFTLRWFSLSEFTPTLFASGALIALFFFWGWDVTLNLNEETKNGEHVSGRGALAAMITSLLLFIGFVVAVLLVLSDAEIQQSSTNVLFALAEKLFPQPWSYLAVFAVMLSSIGTLETSILQFTRTMYAKARDGALQPRYAILHKSWRTPWVATSVIVALGLALLFLSSYFPSINLIIKDSVNAIGFQVAFYYGLAGFACAWHYRSDAMKGIWPFITLLLWPAASASFLVFIACYSIPTFDFITVLIGIGGIAIGIIPMALNRLRQKS